MKKAFTLTELVAVIVIMGLLAGMITPRIVATIEKGRDARRIADIDSLASALQIYHMENSGAYPRVGWEYSNASGFLSELTDDNHITQTIADPKNNATYRYAYKRFNTSPPYAIVGCTKFERLDSMGGNVGIVLYYYKKLYER
ncbi:MAG: prepilin-type N-terminal cleavage/methylation domain-containing protein [Candidatus Saelkia tenebricola]|nr:prepilin-type N-terminal cleavage/methylation domain-containing protein [Candidatus Saelkia tenebricola]